VLNLRVFLANVLLRLVFIIARLAGCLVACLCFVDSLARLEGFFASCLVRRLVVSFAAAVLLL